MYYLGGLGRRLGVRPRLRQISAPQRLHGITNVLNSLSFVKINLDIKKGSYDVRVDENGARGMWGKGKGGTKKLARGCSMRNAVTNAWLRSSLGIIY